MGLEVTSQEAGTNVSQILCSTRSNFEESRKGPMKKGASFWTSIKQWISISDNNGNIQIIHFDALAPNCAALTLDRGSGVKMEQGRRRKL